MSMKRQIARKTDRETHFNSLHLHMSGGEKDFFQQALTTKASLHASVIY